MKKLMFILVIISVLLISNQPNTAASSNDFIQEGMLDIDGLKSPLRYTQVDDRIYVPLTSITKYFGIQAVWNQKDQSITLIYPDTRKIKISTKNKQFYKANNWYPIDVKLIDGSTLVNMKELESVVDRRVSFSPNNNELTLYKYTYKDDGESIANKGNEGFSVKRNSVYFEANGLPKAKWSMDGILRDFRLLRKQERLGIVEYQYAAYYQTNFSNFNYLLFTQRILPNGDQMIFVKGYSSASNQTVIYEVEETNKVYGSSFYKFKDKGDFHTLLDEVPYRSYGTISLKPYESLDQWLIFSKEALDLDSTLAKDTWNTSKNRLNTNTWVTEQGTHRKTPDPYLNIDAKDEFNINLQASTPILLLEALQVIDNRLLEDFVHSSAFTLVEEQGEDGFFRTTVDVAYLNRAFRLGSGFIDTRMSVDASMYLLKYGEMFNDDEAIIAGSHFKQFFNLLNKNGINYENQNGILYPDYYSENQRTKTLVSLNHALYEMNYLYTLYNWIGDEEAKRLADEMLAFIENTADYWITEKGDLYYALSPDGRYYAEDYVNVTYKDLFVSQSILRYMGVNSAEITRLFETKGQYLDDVNSPYGESHLHLADMLATPEKFISLGGKLFMSYPLEVKVAEGIEPIYISYGSYHIFKGIEEISYNDVSYQFDPDKKYLVIQTKEELHIYENPEEIKGITM